MWIKFLVVISRYVEFMPRKEFLNATNNARMQTELANNGWMDKITKGEFAMVC